MKIVIAVLVLLWVIPAQANKVEILGVKVNCPSPQQCDFAVTLKHKDTGWEHYANRWEVRSPDGKVLGVRTLFHPHVNEQPFTRSLANVRIPAGVTEVDVVAFDSVHGEGKQPYRVQLPSGDK